MIKGADGALVCWKDEGNLKQILSYGQRQTDCCRESPLREGYGEAERGMYREIDVRSPFEWKDYLCWLRYRETYPATVVAPL